MEISKTDALHIFSEAKTVNELEKLINEHCHLWFDESKTLDILKRAQKEKGGASFCTVLLSPDGPFIIEFSVRPDGTVSVI
jgi:hypothetical protein